MQDYRFLFFGADNQKGGNSIESKNKEDQRNPVPVLWCKSKTHDEQGDVWGGSVRP